MLNAITGRSQTRLAPLVGKVDYMEPFKARMKRIRLRAGYKSQGEAAAVIGCERGTVGMWEAPSSRVEAVSSDLLFAVAHAYMVRPEWINDLSSTDDGYPWLGSGGVREPAPPYTAEQSQPVGREAEIMREAIIWLRNQFETWRIPFDAADRTEMILEVYRVLASPERPNLVSLSQRIGNTLDGEQRRDGESKTGGTGKNDRPRDAGRPGEAAA